MILSTAQMMAHVEALRALTRLRATLAAADAHADPQCLREACAAERTAIEHARRWEDDKVLVLAQAAEKHVAPRVA